MLEWFEISTELMVVATATRAFLHVPQTGFRDAFDTPMRGAGSPETTHWLLEGALAAAKRAFRAQRDATSPVPRAHGPLNAPQWAYRLAGYFHTTDATRRLLPLVAQRFTDSARRELASWAEQKISEEAGHEQLALRDLDELGYQPQALVSACLPARAAAWVALFEQLAAAADPVGCLGYAHALERLALLRGPVEVRAIEQALPRGVNATRCLRVHSALGSDPRHVQTNISTACTLSADERRAVAEACYATARIYFDPALDDDFQSAKLEASVLDFRRHPGASPKHSHDNPINN